MSDLLSGRLNRRKALQFLTSATVASVLPVSSQAQAAPVQKSTPVARAPRPTKEVRAIWIHPEQHISPGEKEGKAQIRTMVERFARANFTLLLPWTVSGYLAALEHEEYRKDHPTAAWDYLGVLIEEATKLCLLYT